MVNCYNLRIKGLIAKPSMNMVNSMWHCKLPEMSTYSYVTLELARVQVD